MGITIEDLTAHCQDEKKGIYLIHLKTPDSKLIIGIHGQTLEMTKHLLTRILEKTLEASLLIHLEVNDYLQAKDEKFYRYLDSRIAYAMRICGEITLPNLTSYDRKKAHGYISERNIEWIKTFSVGEGPTRELHLSYEAPAGTVPTYTPTTTKTSSVSKRPAMTIEEEGVWI